MRAAAVGAYIGAAYFFTSSTSFANPAITVGRMFSNTFAGIAPSSVPSFVAAQVVGGVLAWSSSGALSRTSPRPRPPTSSFPHHQIGIAASHPARSGLGDRRRTVVTTGRSCCSSASTTPGAAWRHGSCSTTTPRAGSRSGPPGRSRATSSIRRSSRSSRSGASIHPRSSRSRSPTRRPRRRRRRHHGLRGHLPGLPRQALPRLGARGPGGYVGRSGPPNRRRDRPPGEGAPHRACRLAVA